MMRIYSSGDGGLFGLLMGSRQSEPTDHDIEALQAVVDAECDFERLMNHAAHMRIAGADQASAEEMLASLICAWRCVILARGTG